MKRQLTYLIMVAALTATTLTITARNKQVPRIYMFGMAASFTDSLVYFTGVQIVDSAWVGVKDKFLKGRELYSLQLRNYLNDQEHLSHRTCVVYYDENRSKLEKKYLKIRELYTTKARQSFEIHDLTEQQFRFTFVNMSDGEEQ